MKDAVHESPAVEPTKVGMTPMIDVVFQLLVFFLCSMKFKTLDEMIPTDLPRGPGTADVAAPPPPPKLDLRLRRTAASSPVEVRVGGASLGDAAASATWVRLRDHLASVRRNADALGPRDEVRVEVDASPFVETSHVIHALDVLQEVGLTRVQFTGTPPVR